MTGLRARPRLPSCSRSAPGAALALVALILLAAPGVTAYKQEEAPALDARVEAAWASEGVQEGEQWQAFLRLKPGTNVTAVGYQACIVPGACIIQPRNATQADERTWTMDTADYVNPLTRQPYPWPAGKVGVKWFLSTHGSFLNGTALPEGLAADDPQCKANAVACLESHYLTLPVAAKPGGESAPAPAAALVGLALLGLAGRLRRA